MVKLRKLKLMPLILAAVLFLAGVVLVAVGPDETATAVAVGTLILGVGTARLIYGFLTYREEHDAKNNITLGVLDVIWSMMMLLLCDKTGSFVILFGLWCLIAALLEVIEIVRNAIEKKAFLHILADAIINVVFGVVLMVGQSINATMVGAYLVLNALSTVLTTFLSVHTNHEVKEVKEEVKVEPVAAPAEEVEVEVKVAVKKPTTKKATTTKTAEKPATTTAKKSTTTKTTAKAEAKPTATKTTAAKKTTTAKKPATTKKTTTKAADAE